VKVIFIGNKQENTRTVNLNNWVKVFLSLCVLALPTGTGYVLGQLMSDGEASSELVDAVDTMKIELDLQRQELSADQSNAQLKISALTSKLAEMQARLVRLDALGERLTGMADLDKGEFDFSRLPAVGGPADLTLDAMESNHLDGFFTRISNTLDDREIQLNMLEAMLVDRSFQQQSRLEGRPIRKGWMSSKYGSRIDPFTGKNAWHGGIDFAGREGGDVISVAAGVVTWSDSRNGYGQLIEIDHGDGYITRYGHNKKNLVQAGDAVKKGQIIALMGSSGRSTGPHVHFEVFKHGRSVDPASYIRRTIR
jgi:murein DD-endopeptidase MepM/ murein hydrolase activator NlpD